MPVPISNLSAVFANTQQVFVGLGLNVSYTAAATGSRLLELKVNNAPKFWVGLDGIPSTGVSSLDLVARNLAQDAYDLALTGDGAAVGAGANAFTIVTIAGANSAVGAAANSFTSATVAGANAAVGAAANSFASATIAGANTITLTAFTRANTPNIYVANTNASATVVYSSERRIINFIDTSANNGIAVRITDNTVIGAADISFSNYDFLANGVSLSGSSGLNIDNTVLPKRYKMIMIQYDEVSFSTTAQLRLGLSIDNGSNWNFFNLSSSQLAANIVSGMATVHTPYTQGSTTRKVLNTFTSGWDGVNNNFTNSMFVTGSALYGSPINWISLYPSAGTFDGGIANIIGYY